jgi:hypothetical protein
MAYDDLRQSSDVLRSGYRQSFSEKQVEADRYFLRSLLAPQPFISISSASVATDPNLPHPSQLLNACSHMGRTTDRIIT